MVIRTHTTGKITMSAATSEIQLPDVTGKIIAVAIKPSGVSTDFVITTTKAGVTEDIFGTTGGAISVAEEGVIVYPVKAKNLNTTGAALTGDNNIYTPIIIDSSDIDISVSNGAADEYYTVDIIVEE